MRTVLSILAALACVCASAQESAPNKAASVLYGSEVVTNNAWLRAVVMRHEPSGEIYNDSGTVGSAADLAAANVAAESAGEIAEAARASMTNQAARLASAAASTATNALALALVVRPETTRTNLTFYVVKTATDGVTDTQWVWCNWDLSIPPNRFVVYQAFGQCATNKFSWTDWTNKVDVTVNGRTWAGCHVGTVVRPKWARGESCLDLPNDALGGPSGFDFGDLTLTVGGAAPYTGFVTNGVTGEVLYFDQGFNKGNPEDK